MHLEAEGIPVVLADAETAGMVWSLGNAIGHIKLQVPRAAAQRATALLAQMVTKRDQRRDSAEEAGAPRCLACGALLLEEQPVCPSCGWSYATTDAQTEQEDMAELRIKTPPERGETTGTCDRLEQMKRPILWFLLLAPLGLTLVLTVVGLVRLLLFW